MADTHPKTLRALLNGNRIAVLGGAHDALSARIVEEVEFDGVWVSSFGISLAKRCIPDADLLTMTETLDEVRDIASAVTSPVVADCNTGFGDAMNVMRMTAEFEKGGAAGICIEDYTFPKRCSLYAREKRELLSTGEMAGKISAAKAAQRNAEFVVIARTEALIANLGSDVALERASAYAAAGADALLVHSHSFPLLKEFTSRWKNSCPLVVVPTLFSDVSLSELEDCGIRIAIFPNQAIRAAVRAMRHTLQTIRSTGTAKTVTDEIVPLSEVYRLVKLDEMEAAERQFINAQVNER